MLDDFKPGLSWMICHSMNSWMVFRRCEFVNGPGAAHFSWIASDSGDTRICPPFLLLHLNNYLTSFDLFNLIYNGAIQCMAYMYSDYLISYNYNTIVIPLFLFLFWILIRGLGSSGWFWVIFDSDKKNWLSTRSWKWIGWLWLAPIRFGPELRLSSSASGLSSLQIESDSVLTWIITWTWPPKVNVPLLQ